MVLEYLMKKEWMEHKHWIVAGIGLIYTLIGYVTARIFFDKNLSIAILFLITLLITPALMKMLSFEEKKEKEDGTKHFIKDHKEIFENYIALFIGIFLGFFILATITSNMPNGLEETFGYQLNFFSQYKGTELIETIRNLTQPAAEHFIGITLRNITVAIVTFLLAFFYGAGAIFLIILNGSVFAVFIFDLINKLGGTLSQSIGVGSVFLLHMLPEVFGFLLAAIAGGVISKAVVQEKIGSEGFRNVIKDGSLILLISLAIIIIAAAIESFISRGLISSLI